MIGDGMGFEEVNLARLVEKGNTGPLIIETLPFQLKVTTQSADSLITDSAAAATAIAAGNKTNNGFLSITPDLQILKTILEYAHEANLSTGLVTTTEITHATPAAFASHDSSRGDTTSISAQYVDNQSVDIFMGGGKNRFTANQITTMISNGYSLLEDRDSLLSTNATKIFGIFSVAGHLPYELDRNRTFTPSLAEMTTKSLSILSKNSAGFFLMVEGGKIDHAGHANNKVDNVLETIEFDEAVAVAKEFAEQHKNTLLIVTADHETGGLQILSNTLNSTLPDTNVDEETAESLRVARVNNVTVSWSTSDHTGVQVGFWGFGSSFFGYINNSVIDNTDIFKMMSSYLQNPAYLEPPLGSLSTTKSLFIPGLTIISILSIFFSYYTTKKPHSRK
jgi:alkaline phosphatase